MGGHQLGGPINPVMQAGMPPQQQGPQQPQLMNQINPAQLNTNSLTQTQLGHLQRKVHELTEN